jgi:hypothetical protein
LSSLTSSEVASQAVSPCAAWNRLIEPTIPKWSNVSRANANNGTNNNRASGNKAGVTQQQQGQRDPRGEREGQRDQQKRGQPEGQRDQQ